MYIHTHAYTHTHIYTTEYYPAIKEKEILLLVTTWMAFDGFVLSEIGKMEKDKYCLPSYKKSLKNSQKKGLDL